MWEVGYGLSLEGAAAADLVKSMRAEHSTSGSIATRLDPACHLTLLRKGKSHEHPGKRFFGSVT